jgi:hypothetical protein
MNLIRYEFLLLVGHRSNTNESRIPIMCSSSAGFQNMSKISSGPTHVRSANVDVNNQSYFLKQRKSITRRNSS